MSRFFDDIVQPSFKNRGVTTKLQVRVLVDTSEYQHNLVLHRISIDYTCTKHRQFGFGFSTKTNKIV